MRAVVYDQFGDPEVLRLADVPAPSARPGHCRVEVHAAALNPKDVLLRKGKMRWIGRARWPRICGYDIAGVLVDDADGLAAGTEVFGMIQSHLGGGCAEVAVLPFDQVAAKPTGLSMAEAASLPLAGLTALQGIRDHLDVRPDQALLLNGASGGVGTLAVQVGVALGAEVIGVCSERNATRVEALGASRIVDYTRTDPADLRDLDAVFDIFGTLPWRRAKPMLTPTGRFCTTIPRAGAVARSLLSRARLHRASLVVVQSRRRDLDTLRQYVDAGALKPVVDRIVALEDAVQGHRRLETRRAQGKVVVQIR